MTRKKADRPQSGTEAVDITEKHNWNQLERKDSIEGQGGQDRPAKRSRRTSADKDSKSGKGRTERKSGAAKPSVPIQVDEEIQTMAAEAWSDSTAAAVIVLVEADSKRPSMFQLAVMARDEEEAILLNVHADTLVGWRLLKGRRLSREEWAGLQKEEQKEEAYRAALSLLNFKARTGKELRTALKRKEFEPEAIEGCMERIVAMGLVNDGMYARHYAEQRATGQRKGSRLIRQELLQRGIDKQDVEQAIGELDGDVERQSAIALAAKRWPSMKGKTERERQTKLLGVLLRRGFPHSAAWEAVRQVTSAVAEGEEDWEATDGDIGIPLD